MHEDLRDSTQAGEAMRRFEALFREQGLGSLARFAYSEDHTIARQDLTGLRVLDVGCGNGLKSIYLALRTGAEEWVGLDEYAGEGSDKENLHRFREYLDRVRPGNVRQVVSSLEDNSLPDHGFDVIVAVDACHHFETPAGQIREDPSLLSAFKPYFEEFRRLLKPEGRLIIRDLMRHNVSEVLGFGGRGIDWKSKQDPEDWAEVLSATGFHLEGVHYYVPFSVRRFHPLLANKPAAYLLKSRYTLVATLPQRG